MATLKELWLAGGCKRVSVVRSDGERFTMLGITPVNDAVGYHPITSLVCWQRATIDCWSLYEEPRPKKKLYAFLAKNVGLMGSPITGFSPRYFEQENPEPMVQEVKLIRVPQFDCEVDDVG